MICKIDLPFPISVNQLYGQTRSKGRVGRYTMPKYKTWKQEAMAKLSTQNISFLKRRVDVEIWLHNGHPNSDCDNFIKCIMDFLVKQGIIFDDKKAYVRSVKVQWTLTKEKYATVEIKEIENEMAN